MFFIISKQQKGDAIYDDTIKVLSFFLWLTPIPLFYIPSKLVSWSAQLLEPSVVTLLWATAWHKVCSNDAKEPEDSDVYKKLFLSLGFAEWEEEEKVEDKAAYTLNIYIHYTNIRLLRLTDNSFLTPPLYIV